MRKPRLKEVMQPTYLHRSLEPGFSFSKTESQDLRSLCMQNLSNKVKYVLWMKCLQGTSEAQQNKGSCRARTKWKVLVFFSLNQHNFQANIQLSFCLQVLCIEHSSTSGRKFKRKMRSGPGSNEAKVMGSERSALGDVVKQAFCGFETGLLMS